MLFISPQNTCFCEQGVRRQVHQVRNVLAYHLSVGLRYTLYKEQQMGMKRLYENGL